MTATSLNVLCSADDHRRRLRLGGRVLLRLLLRLGGWRGRSLVLLLLGDQVVEDRPAVARGRDVGIARARQRADGEQVRARGQVAEVRRRLARDERSGVDAALKALRCRALRGEAEDRAARSGAFWWPAEDRGVGDRDGRGLTC